MYEYKTREINKRQLLAIVFQLLPAYEKYRSNFFLLNRKINDLFMMARVGKAVANSVNSVVDSTVKRVSGKTDFLLLNVKPASETSRT